ncbi:transporter [Malaciobacter marinus]|uniref:ACT domain-containing protein n=1 Tax=Malaciobacter marinus TaxID=505249 RepID=UPI000C07F6E6|nr:ACT domain-containing protein [Malaciobacter marinus]PHO11342.1 transporter [Malaciobacter marinus]
MSGIVDIKVLLKDMNPVLDDTDYVFCTKKCFEINEEIMNLNPICTFLESEGMTLIISKDRANQNGLSYESIFSKITLEIHSSLDAVGLTAAFSNKLTSHGISANVVAGYYHDHIFVQKDKALAAIEALEELSK